MLMRKQYCAFRNPCFPQESKGFGCGMRVDDKKARSIKKDIHIRTHIFRDKAEKKA
ncbi:hypothetical protein Bwad004_30180 [Bilophila wadsworthia]